MTNYKIDIDSVKRAAKGQWDVILPKIMPFFGTVSDKKRGPCPVHGGKSNQAFRMLDDYVDTGGGACNSCGVFPDGLSLLQWASGMSFYEALKEVYECVGSPDYQSIVKLKPQAPPVDKQAVDESDRKALKSLLYVSNTWLLPTHPDAEPLRKYLAKRGLKTVPGTLRFHRGLNYKHDDKYYGKFPVMLALVTSPEHRGVTIHRTFLTEDGDKAPVPEVKKLMSHTSTTTLRGAAIRLAPCDEVLGVSEGIETGIAAMEGTGIPVWPTVSAQLMKSFKPPRGVKRVVIFEDKDASRTGERSGFLLQERLLNEGYECLRAIPPSELNTDQKTVDWLDEYVDSGRSAFAAVHGWLAQFAASPDALVAVS